MELYIRVIDDFRFTAFLDEFIREPDDDVYQDGLSLNRLLAMFTEDELCDSSSIVENDRWREATKLSRRLAKAIEAIHLRH